MGFVFYFSSGFTFFLREIKDNAYAVFFGGGRGKQGLLWVISKWQIMLYSSTWNLIIIINIITSIGQYSLGLVFECLLPWLRILITYNKRNYNTNNKTPRGLSSIVLFLLFVMTVPAERPEYFRRDNFENLKNLRFSAQIMDFMCWHSREVNLVFCS